MRAFLSIGWAGFALGACAGGAGHHAHGPAGIPYMCDGGRGVRITYEGGGYYPRGTAELFWEGRDIHLVATPPTHGLRYQEPRDERPILVWMARAERASIIELSADSSEREIAHCARVREPGIAEAPGEIESAPH